MRAGVVVLACISCRDEVINPRPAIPDAAPTTVHVYAPGTQKDAPWPVYRHDEGFTGRSNARGAKTGAIRWAVDVRAPVGSSSPVVAADGTVIVGSTAGTLTAVTPDGTVRWRSMLGGAVEGAPAIAADGSLYVAANDAQLHHIAADGTLLATSLARTSIRSPVIIDGDGVGYFSIFGGLACHATPGMPIECGYGSGLATETVCPFEIANGHLYLGTEEFFDAPFDGGTVLSPGVFGAVDGDGILYAFTYSGTRLETHDASGKWRWAADLDIPKEDPLSPPSIAIVDASFVYALREGVLFAVGPNGVVWRKTVNAVGALAVDADGAVYFGSMDGRIYGVDRTGGQLFATATNGAVRSSPAIGMDGTVYAGSDDGHLYAIAP